MAVTATWWMSVNCTHASSWLLVFIPWHWIELLISNCSFLTSFAAAEELDRPDKSPHPRKKKWGGEVSSRLKVCFYRELYSTGISFPCWFHPFDRKNCKHRQARFVWLLVNTSCVLESWSYPANAGPYFSPFGPKDETSTDLLYIIVLYACCT